ncbi:hypothetical protein [Rhizobium redzepovicii]|uniref:hypothetical protein n=1 Tax=Rhizobium redzepovicii TaxID=2867518 RepID=UPI001FEC4FD3|nr:hypothetical protein [Rhizobium redzepovicii]
MTVRPSPGTKIAARSSAPSSTPTARAYGLTHDELGYILDPADLKGPDYPSEAFRVLKEKEIRQYGEYRTRRLVLEAWAGWRSRERLPLLGWPMLYSPPHSRSSFRSLDSSLMRYGLDRRVTLIGQEPPVRIRARLVIIVRTRGDMRQSQLEPYREAWEASLRIP